jgi:hypothetical protein
MSEESKRKSGYRGWDGSHVKMGSSSVVIYISAVRNGRINPLPIRRGTQSKRYGLILQGKPIIRKTPIDLYVCLRFYTGTKWKDDVLFICLLFLFLYFSARINYRDLFVLNIQKTTGEKF